MFAVAFYGRIQQDSLLGPILTDVARVDWSHHLPKMYAFWTASSWASRVYQGAPFPPHTVLPVGREHFERWVALFNATVDEHFSGSGAQRAKNAAASIAHTFAMRMGVIDPMRRQVL